MTTGEFKSYTDIKKYVGVKFVGFGETNDIIPKKWIVKWEYVTKTCAWPPSNIRALAKENAEVSALWKTYKIIPLCHASMYRYFPIAVFLFH